MSAMPVIRPGNLYSLLARLAASLVIFSIIQPIPSSAVLLNSIPARNWGYLYANDSSAGFKKSQNFSPDTTQKKQSNWSVSFSGFPTKASTAVEFAIDIWSHYFESKVPVTVEAVWELSEDREILGSARPGEYFNNFKGAPDQSLWYPSAIANALAGRDLNTNQKDIYLRLNESVLWYFGTDGSPGAQEYDLVSVVLHEIAHGLGFLSNAEYDQRFGTGYIFQPTPFDAYIQLPDGRKFIDFCSRSVDLGKAMRGPLYWSGAIATEANNGVKPRLHAASEFEQGSSITHLDEETFSNSGINAMMTPFLRPGDVFRAPGPVVLAMIEDMHKKPPQDQAKTAPTKPSNVKALIGNGYALVTFDSSACGRTEGIVTYEIKINPTGEKRTFKSSPAKIIGLKNYKSYSFTVAAKNNYGKSIGVTSNVIEPQGVSKPIELERGLDSRFLATGTFRGIPVVAYTDSKKGNLKLAKYENNRWNIVTVDGSLTSKIKTKENVSGPVSLCVSKWKERETLHLFYSDIDNQDLRHATFDGVNWRYEVVDGDGNLNQSSSTASKRKTSNNVSVSNACAVNASGIQVFYRDDTEGLLLSASLTAAGWTYEIVDGDRNSDGRTTGDVGLSLRAISLGKTVYVLYDSIIYRSSNNLAVQGETRLAKRDSLFPEDWEYKTLDGPSYGVAVAGYRVALSKKNGTVVAAWLSANGKQLPDPDEIKYQYLVSDETYRTIENQDLGTPHSPLAIYEDQIIFGCAKRLCSLNKDTGKARLLSGDFLAVGVESSALKITNTNYVIFSHKNKLMLLKL